HRVAKSEFFLQRWREHGQRLTIQIVHAGGKHEHTENPPAIARSGDGAHWNSMVATSPAVANLESVLGKYSIVTGRFFCTPQESVAARAPANATLLGSAISSFTTLWSDDSTVRRACCFGRQSTCFNTPVILPVGCGKSDHAIGFSVDAVEP